MTWPPANSVMDGIFALIGVVQEGCAILKDGYVLLVEIRDLLKKGNK